MSAKDHPYRSLLRNAEPVNLFKVTSKEAHDALIEDDYIHNAGYVLFIQYTYVDELDADQKVNQIVLTDGVTKFSELVALLDVEDLEGQIAL